ncbi:lysoplasmalogenase family protein [Croceicoccus mobilis]|uniref:Lysoplasmalogenase n=1 Tax=Croceicoccus mobilis TaxID=1703339 RepID=A0A916YW10_9SPHN|nr:lysoplasmalogenase family protein [Croceicoccus mobilis]GGD63663.1 hypothetical protein GCM10010990_11440 [Croceicoccus mobilis]
MPKRALIERRPWLMLSIVMALVWWLGFENTMTPGLYLLGLKFLPVAFLAVYSWRRHHGLDGRLIAAVMGIAAIGDALTTLEYGWGGIAHALSQLVAIVLYWRNHRPGVRPAMMLAGLAAVVIAPVLAWLLMVGEVGQGAVAASAALLAITAAIAWLSRFPRQRVGLGALLYLVSELLLIATQAHLLEVGGAVGLAVSELVWPLYYIGQLLIVTGVNRTLRSREIRK